eukprot:6185163-Pleurochrysis_carterae.AAC.1
MSAVRESPLPHMTGGGYVEKLILLEARRIVANTSTPTQAYWPLKPATHSTWPSTPAMVPLILYLSYLTLYDVGLQAGGPRRHWTIAACKITSLPAANGGKTRSLKNSLNGFGRFGNVPANEISRLARCRSELARIRLVLLYQRRM